MRIWHSTMPAFFMIEERFRLYLSLSTVLLLAVLTAACGSGSSGGGGGGGSTGGGAIASLSFISPIVTMQNSAAFALTVNGSGFSSASRVEFNGAAEPTSFVNSSQLTAQIPSSALASPGTLPVAVATGGSNTGAVNFYVVPSISAQTVTVTAGPGAVTTANISVPPFNPPVLGLTAVGLNNTAGATAVSVAPGTQANLFIVGSGIAAGTFYEVTSANNDVTVAQPLVSSFTSTTNGMPAVNVNIHISSTATLGGRNLIVTNPAGEVAVAVGSIVIARPGS